MTASAAGASRSTAPTDRGEIAKKAFRDLADAIARDVSLGIGKWEKAWEMVEDDSILFMDAIDRFVEGEAELKDVVAAGNKLRETWRKANAEYLERKNEDATR